MMRRLLGPWWARILFLIVIWAAFVWGLVGCTTPRVPPADCRAYVNRALDIRLCPYHADCHLAAEDLAWLRGYQQTCEP